MFLLIIQYLRHLCVSLKSSFSKERGDSVNWHAAGCVIISPINYSQIRAPVASDILRCDTTDRARFTALSARLCQGPVS
jgi:hypothetical protein